MPLTTPGPRFDYQWKDDRTLVMHYKSDRGLVDILVGLIKAVGRYYKEALKVKKLNEHEGEVLFPAECPVKRPAHAAGA